jgi:hypothetical protein
MYSTVITFKADTSENILRELRATCDRAFDNRAGRAIRRNDRPERLIYEGGEELYGCLHLGNLTLYKTGGFKDAVRTWDWIDEDPDESCDILKSLSIPIY